MYAMTAAHPTLPLPSYARVTNVATGKSVVVRVNDRGPFLHDRVIDLSYAAATKLGIAQKGSGEVEVEAIIPARNGRCSPPPRRCRRSPRRRSRAAPAGTPAGGGVRAHAGRERGRRVRGSARRVRELRQRAEFRRAPREPDRSRSGSKRRCARSDGLFRVFVGPYPTRDDAKRTADRAARRAGAADDDRRPLIADGRRRAPASLTRTEGASVIIRASPMPHLAAARRSCPSSRPGTDFAPHPRPDIRRAAIDPHPIRIPCAA